MNDINPIQQNLSFFFEKNGTYNEEIPLLIMNKFISYSNTTIASKIDEHFFRISTEINKQRLLLSIPKQKIPFIKYYKKQEQDNEFEFLFEKIKKYYNMSERELNTQREIYLKMFQDKKILKEYFMFFGIEKDKYNEYGINNKKKLGDYNEPRSY